MSEEAHRAVEDVKKKGKQFYESARAGKLDEGQLRWGLSAGAVVSAISLLLPYFGYELMGNSVSYSGLDLLSFRGGMSLNGLMCMAIPLSPIFALYLVFGDGKLGWLQMNLPGRPRLVYLCGMIAAILGSLACVRFIFHQFRIGSLLGLLGLGLMAFVYFKLWERAPAAPAVAPAADATPDGPEATGE